MLLALLLLTASADAPVTPAAPAKGNAVVLWRRAAGGPHKDLKAASVTVTLDSLPSVQRTMNDVRGAGFSLRGVSFDALLAKAPFDDKTDAIILRFHNGTRIQMKRNEAARFDIFLARAWRMSDQGAWSSKFEAVPLGTPNWSAARSLEFGGHRVFVKNADPPRGAGTFNPWGFVDSLEEVELVNEAAWRQSFDVGTEAAKDGLKVWENRCQTCHGARGAGARLGWDFVDPLPVASWRNPQSLFDHVRAHKLNSAEIGLLMPPQPDVTLEEITSIHAWMQALAARKTLNEYQP